MDLDISRKSAMTLCNILDKVDPHHLLIALHERQGWKQQIVEDMKKTQPKETKDG